MIPTVVPQANIPVWLFAHEQPSHVVIQHSRAWQLRAPPFVSRIRPGQAVHIRWVEGRVEAVWGLRRHTAGTMSMQGPGVWTLKAGGRQLTSSGELRISPRAHALRPELKVPLQFYLPGVLAAESDSKVPAALEAMAVCVRSFTLRALRAPRHGSAATCDATHCQRFRPPQHSPERLVKALQATRGEYRTWHNEVAETLWHAACGGQLSSAYEAFQREHVPYLRGGPDTRSQQETAWCDVPPGRWNWQADITRSQWQASLSRAGLPSAGSTLRVVTRGPGGRVTRIQWGESSAQTLTGQSFWEMLGPIAGWQGLRSLKFEVHQTPSGWRFSGSGLGHGVGLCQAGADGRARAGSTREAILSAYFPGTRSDHTSTMP